MPVSRSRSHSRKRRERRGSPRRSNFDHAINASDRLRRDVVERAIASLPPSCRIDRVTEPEQSEPRLHECRTALETLAAEWVSGLDAYTWLFYLRRIPDRFFAGRLATTAPYRRMLADVLTASTTREATFTEPPSERRVLPPITRDQAESIVRLVHLTGPLAQIHSVLRRSGKGQRTAWWTDDFPWVVPTPELDAAIELYDRRVEAHGSLHAGTRVVDFHPFFAPLRTPIDAAGLLLSVRPVDAGTVVPVWRGPVGSAVRVSGRPGRFVIGADSLSPAVRLLSRWAGEGWGSQELAAVLLLLRSLFVIALTEDWFATLGKALTDVGYLVLPKRSLGEILERHVGELRGAGLGLGAISLPDNGGAAVETLVNLSSAPWPLDPGPILREAGEQSVVDVRSASLWLDRLLTVDKDSPSGLVNARAAHFEELVQHEIDSTPAVPPGVLRELRGRELRRDGTPITDIDALAVLGDTLLLVSCKSIVRSPELDAGVYARVRNVRTDLERYDAYWQGRMAFLRTNPKGDNYDLRPYRIAGVVCTPAVEFTHAEQSRPILGDLTAVTSFQELLEFLRGSDGTAGAGPA